MTPTEPQGIADLDKVGAALELRPADHAGLGQAMATVGLPSPSEFAALRGLAEQFAESDLVPVALRKKPANVMLVMLTGRDLGISPTVALKLVHVVDGKTGLAAELMVALVRRAGFAIWPDPTNNREQATAHTERDGRSYSLTFTLDDAIAAGLCTRSAETGAARARSQAGHPKPWETYTQFMLHSRSVSGLCRMVFPDLLMGVAYTPEELGGNYDHDGHEVIDVDPSAYRPAGSPDPAEQARREAEAEASFLAGRNEAARRDGWEDAEHSESCWALLVEMATEADPLVAEALRTWKQKHPGKSVLIWDMARDAFCRLAEMVAEARAEPFGDPPPAAMFVDRLETEDLQTEAAATKAEAAEPMVDAAEDAGDPPATPTQAPDAAPATETTPEPSTGHTAPDPVPLMDQLDRTIEAHKAGLPANAPSPDDRPVGRPEPDPIGPWLPVEGEPEGSANAWHKWVREVDKDKAVEWLRMRDVPTNGSVTDVRARMINHAHLRAGTGL